MSQPRLPKLQLGALHEITVDSIAGHGAARATLSVTRRPPIEGRPGKCLLTASDVTRSDLIEFALELLQLSEQMVDHKAYASSLASGSDDSLLPSLRLADATRRYFRLRDRLPGLQLAQRVLEKCDDTVVSTLLVLLGTAETSGKLPVRMKVNFGVSGTEADEGGDDPLPAPPSGSKH